MKSCYQVIILDEQLMRNEIAGKRETPETLQGKKDELIGRLRHEDLEVLCEDNGMKKPLHRMPISIIVGANATRVGDQVRQAASTVNFQMYVLATTTYSPAAF